MINASICTIGDEILIGQIVDTNSSEIARSLDSAGVRVSGMESIADNREQIIKRLSNLLRDNDLVISTGGLGPTRDDITKDALAELSGSSRYIKSDEQEKVVREILHSRGLDVLEANLRQALVPETCEVIVNRRGTAPVMVFRFPDGRFGHPSTLYSLPGVPHEALSALPEVIEDIRAHFEVGQICHRTIMVYGLAESALAKLIEPWEETLPSDMHLAYLPNMLTGIRLRLSVYGGDKDTDGKRLSERLEALKAYLGNKIYSEQDDTLERTVGRLLRGSGKTLSVAESATGGEIAHLLTTVGGSSEYFLGSVTSYAPELKEKILGVPEELIKQKGIVSRDVAAAMAEGVRRLTGSTFSVATTGWADSAGDSFEPAGTVWVGVSGPRGTVCERFSYHNDRKRNIERFSASALDTLRRYILETINN